MRTRLTGIFAAALVVLGAHGAAAATLAIDMVPGGAIDVSRVQAPGDAFSIDVVADDVPDLAGFQFVVTFDPTILDASSIASGGIFGLDTVPVVSVIGLASITFSETTLAPIGLAVVAPTVLATIQFTVVGEGTCTLALQSVVLADTFGDPLALAAAAGGQLVSQRPDVVPEPASLLLTAIGLCGLLARRRTP